MKTAISLALACLASTLVLSPALAGAAEIKIATVDVNQILNQSKEAQKMKKDLDELSRDVKGKIEAKRKTLQETEKKLKDSHVSENSEEFEKFRVEVRNFDRYVKDTEDEMKQKFFKTNKTLAETALKTITEYAKANNIDLVIDKSAGGRGPVLFGAPSVDITEQVLKQIGK